MNWKPWLHGLGSAFIGGGAHSVGAWVIAPDRFNLAEGLHNIFSMWAISGVISAALYLARSPLPELNGVPGASRAEK